MPVALSCAILLNQDVALDICVQMVAPHKDWKVYERFKVCAGLCFGVTTPLATSITHPTTPQPHNPTTHAPQVATPVHGKWLVALDSGAWCFGVSYIKPIPHPMLTGCDARAWQVARRVGQ